VGKLHEKQIIATLIWNHSTSSIKTSYLKIPLLRLEENEHLNQSHILQENS
jgi:hypothetical protein